MHVAAPLFTGCLTVFALGLGGCAAPLSSAPSITQSAAAVVAHPPEVAVGDESAIPKSDDAAFAGWRRLRSDGGGEPVSEERLFVMVHGAAKPARRYEVVDLEHGRLLCCLQVQAGALSEDRLVQEFHLPGPWVTDLVNGWNLDGPFRPSVYAAVPVDALAADDRALLERQSRPGGLAAAAGARFEAPATLALGTRRHLVENRLDALADDDGAVETFTLRPAGERAEPVIIEVPFATY